MDEVFLTESAFLGIIISSVEVYKKECLGVLLGHREVDRLTVQYAIPYQSAKRRAKSVEPNLTRAVRCIEELPHLSHLNHLGYFHSHTQYGQTKARPEPSEQDLSSMAVGHLEIIVAINEAKRSQDWTINRRGYLSGAATDHSFSMAAYYFHEQKRVWQHMEIVCPYAVGLWSAFER